MTRKFRYTLLLFLLFSLLSACKITAPANISSSIQIPSDFKSVADSTSIGKLQWKTFFTDPFLIRLIDTALKNNPDMGIAIQRVELARQNVRIARGASLPAINAEAVTGVRRFSDYTIDGVGNYDTNLSEHIGDDRRIPNPTPEFFLGFRSSWEIDLWGKLKSRRNAAYQRMLASEMGVRLVKTQVVAEVARLYYQLLAYDNELKIIRENIKLQETALEMITLQKIGGRATELAVKQFTAQLLNTKSLEAGIQQDITATENQLNTLLGQFGKPINRGRPINKQELPREITVGVPSHLLLNRPDIRQAELHLSASKEDLNAARATFYPSLVISGHAGLHAFKPGLLFQAPESFAFGILGGLTAPVFNRYRIKAGYNQSIIASKTEVLNYQKTILTGFNEVHTSLSRINNIRKMMELKEQQVEVLQQAVSISNDLFLAGYATYLEVVTAQKNVLEAELELTNSRKEQFISTINLYQALGGGWE